jgi:hypothetical protein
MKKPTQVGNIALAKLSLDHLKNCGMMTRVI